MPATELNDRLLLNRGILYILGKPLYSRIVYAVCVCVSGLILVYFTEEARRTEFMNNIRTKNCNQSVSRAKTFSTI